MIRAIVFDFDGVLAESAEIKTWAFAKLFEAWPNEAELLIEFHQNNMGISRYEKFRYFYEELLNQPYDEETGLEMGRKFSELVLNAVIEAPAVEGATDFLKEHSASLRFFIASGTPVEELELIVQKRSLGEYFSGVYGSPRKKDEIVKDIIQEYELSADEIVFVGDASSDLRAATEVGTHFVARITGPDSPLLDCRYALPDLRGLIDVIKELNAL